jgi:hypothetical protein
VQPVWQAHFFTDSMRATAVAVVGRYACLTSAKNPHHLRSGLAEHRRLDTGRRNEVTRVVRAHRYALAAAMRSPLPGTVNALHECDNPLWVRVSECDVSDAVGEPSAIRHVVAGTQRDNWRRLGRSRLGGGGRSGRGGFVRAGRWRDLPGIWADAARAVTKPSRSPWAAAALYTVTRTPPQVMLMRVGCPGLMAGDIGVLMAADNRGAVGDQARWGDRRHARHVGGRGGPLEGDAQVVERHPGRNVEPGHRVILRAEFGHGSTPPLQNFAGPARKGGLQERTEADARDTERAE